MLFEKQIVNVYKKMMYARCDDTKSVFYFSAKDFEGLECVPYGFDSVRGHRLVGCLYSYTGYDEERLVVFDHGFGGGHRAYMKEIETLCRHGYRVLAYDHTGCMESGGESAMGLAQSLCDLNDCISAIKADDTFDGLKISVMGHSWGAFSTMNITALHPDITHIVAMCGFVSVKEMLNTFFSGFLKRYTNAVFALETKTNPRFALFNAAESLASCDTKALLIYSDDDTLCKRCHYDILKEALSERENVDIMLLSGKGHNPNYTASAVRYLGEFTQKRAKLLKKKKLTDAEKASFAASFDFDRMTEQDTEVWARIFEHLDS